MMRWAVLTVAALVLALGCGGAAPPETTACPRATVCPTAPAPGAHATDPTCPDCPRAVQKPGHPLSFDAGHGFWCGPRPGRDGGAGPSALVVECYRQQETCEGLREARIKAGEPTGPCERADSAACFVQCDLKRHACGFRCYDAPTTCQVERASYMHESGERWRTTACERTSRAELGRRGARVAGR